MIARSLQVIFLAVLSLSSLHAAESADSAGADDTNTTEAPAAMPPTDNGTPVQSMAVISGKFEACAPPKDDPSAVGTFLMKSGTKYFVHASPDVLKKLNATTARGATVRGRIQRKVLEVVEVVQTPPVFSYRKRAGF